MWNDTNTQEQLVKGVIKYGPSILDHCKTSDDISQYLDRIAQEHLDYPVPKKDIDSSKWFIPYDYANMDIESFLVEKCPKENYDRLIKELDLFRQHDMLPLLKTMKYIVDTLKSNNIVWGVGRGSSVASYVLFLLGVHRIDSVKYSLPIEEFFKGEQNG
jgi:DNA polymerase III alpha subunit